MDIHLWKECPLLTKCSLCNQIIEISLFNQHLLEECDHKKTQHKCPRCKESIQANEFKQHIEDMSCLPHQPANIGNRCPLCHQDISPGGSGWKDHLVDKGCPNNERTM